VHHVGFITHIQVYREANQQNVKELSESVIKVQWNMGDISTLMMGVRPSSGTFFVHPYQYTALKPRRSKSTYASSKTSDLTSSTLFYK
jgi:hypothetical protein